VNSRDVSIAAAMAEAAREINAPRDVQATLDAIVKVAAAQLPDMEHVSVSIAHRDGSIETRAASDDLVLELDEIQYALREGPCVTSMNGGDVTVVEHLRHDQRWPRFTPQAARRGVLAQLAVRLYVDEHARGALNMYSTRGETIGEDTRQMAQLFATHAALALGRSRREEQLGTALRTRKLVGQAIGLVMGRHSLNEDRAFAYLVRVSSTSNTKLHDIAAHMVAEANAKDPPTAPN
jgi:GAF domain-containing protein